ncbi:hypothetical protein ACU8NW_16805 [Rhizobium leguminosarum]|uniref:hypothetical protein n=1 Tax=Rhizobium leguminosarum TaxID=384 RepID=UPI0012FB5C84|nr:hypothetical protein [Rhizobium leguminosarum]MVO94417.1 hypothetical protein [Rhizobium leguminosarum bv. phaseoli]
MRQSLERYIGRMDAIHVLLIFAVVVGLIYLAGRWNASDADHYMGFEHLRSPLKRKPQNEDEDTKKE